jgi:steroid 5-alpha reductase family enzyme
MRKIITPTVVLALSSLFAYCLGGQSRTLWGYPIAWILVAYSILLQIVVSIPAMIYNTEKYYDLTGSLTFISITAIATFTNHSLTLEQIIAAGMVFAWAGRLGSFLFLRILKVGQDSRFVSIKKTKIRFFYAWIIQGLWIVVTIGPLLSVMITKNAEGSDALGLLEYVGIAIWVVGLLVEIISDSQKSAFNDNPINKDRFVSTGLWSYSRHPNYVG